MCKSQDPSAKMVMTQFVTTYRKDYLWPYVRTLGLKPEPESTYRPRYRDGAACECHHLPETTPTAQQRSLRVPHGSGDGEWSRLGPMGPLLEPKVYAAKVSAAPESEVARYNQPNVFLKKLKEKYPFIYECLKVAPPDDILARINKDRLATTYQVDYCKKREYPSAPYEQLLRAAGVEGVPPCPEPTRLPGDVYRPRPNSKALGITQTIKGIGSDRAKSDYVERCNGGFVFTSGITEYQDTISRLGNMIVRDRLHDPTRRTRKY